jgi:RNA polymerase sigma-70 factor (ECF subfamily)
MPVPEPDHKPASAEGRFASTHWSVVLAAARTASPEAQAALEKLCVVYWYPLYAYLRRRGHPPAEAEDLTQEFFATRVVTKRIFLGAEPAAGRFRSWLLTSLQNLVKNEWEKQQAAKRGGTHPHLPLDFDSAEGRYLAEPAHDLTPEKLYDRTWALTVVELVVDRLREKYLAEDKAGQFDELKMFLPGEESTRSYAQVAARLGRSEDAVKMAVSRLRHEYGQLLRNEIERTLGSPGGAEEELRCLLAALSS